MSTPRGALCTKMFRGKIYAFGGWNAHSFTDSDAVEVYDPASDRWTTAQPMPVPRSFFGAGAVNERIYIIGGSVAIHPNMAPTVAVYDPKKDTWLTNEVTPMPTARIGVSASEFNRRIYVFGGWGNSRGALQTVEAYNPGSDSFFVPPQRKLTTTWGEIKHNN